MLNHKDEITGLFVETISALFYCCLIYTAVIFAVW